LYTASARGIHIAGHRLQSTGIERGFHLGFRVSYLGFRVFHFGLFFSWGFLTSILLTSKHFWPHLGLGLNRMPGCSSCNTKFSAWLNLGSNRMPGCSTCNTKFSPWLGLGLN
jgi:hypothetical protein